MFLLPVENTYSHLVGYSQDVWHDGHKMPYTPPPHPRSTVHTRGGGGGGGGGAQWFKTMTWGQDIIVRLYLKKLF